MNKAKSHSPEANYLLVAGKLVELKLPELLKKVYSEKSSLATIPCAPTKILPSLSETKTVSLVYIFRFRLSQLMVSVTNVWPSVVMIFTLPFAK